MYKVFNMGHRFEIYLPEEFANDIISISKSFNIEAKIVGRCKKSDKNISKSLYYLKVRFPHVPAIQVLIENDIDLVTKDDIRICSVHYFLSDW